MCHYYFVSDIYLTKLDTKNYPVFKITQFILPNDTDIITANTELKIVSKITGGVKYYQKAGNFYNIIDIENNNENKTALALCLAEISFESIESNFSCYLDINEDSYQFISLYLLPYSLVVSRDTYFEVLIKDIIKAKEEYIPPDPSPTDTSTIYPPDFSRYLANSIFILLFIFIF